MKSTWLENVVPKTEDDLEFSETGASFEGAGGP